MLSKFKIGLGAFLVAAFCLSPLLAETTPEYWIHFQPVQRAGMLVHDNPTHQPVAVWVAHKEGYVEWLNGDFSPGSGKEFSIVRDGWVLITAFDQWPADCLQAEVEDINTGVRSSISCSKGHFYVPLLVPKDPFRLRIWGVIAGGPKKFYWEADFYPGEQKLNSCWYQGPTTASVVRQQEVWYDTDGGWVRGTGTSPWDSFGKPIRPQVVKQWEVTLAKGKGVWTMQNLVTNEKFCLYSIWDWK